MLQIDRVVELDGSRIACETDLPDNWVFEVHFPGDPIFPGSLMIEGAGQAIAIWAWENGLRGDPRLVRVAAEFRSPVYPQDRVLTYVAEIRNRRNLCIGRVEVSAAGRPVAAIEETLVVTACNGARRNGGAATTEL